DDRGNLVSDGTFTYAYNGAGRMVRAESVTVTLVYTYSAAGLRVAQSVDGDVTTFAWDWASGLPEMLSDGASVYLVGHDTLGRWDGATWAYHLPDALGSVRQATDGAGAVTDSREWTPFGMEVGAAQAGLGYTGEWWDADVGLLYLRARWYLPGDGIFTSRDAVESEPPYQYVRGNPHKYTDPTGMIPTYESVSCGDHSFSCRCGWVDWAHAGPRTARAIKDRILANILDDCGSPEYKVIETGQASLLPPTGGLAVVRKDLSLQERQQVALGIFMSLEEEIEDAQLAIERMTFGLTKSGYALEDLPSDLIGFYVAWMTDKGISGDDLRKRVGLEREPPCYVLDQKDSLEIFEVFEESGLLYEKNRQWAPLEIPGGCFGVQAKIAEKCGDMDTSWPADFSGVIPEPEQRWGKWWWWEGLGGGEHIYPARHVDPPHVTGVFSYFPYGYLP
ncbi:MAG: RHS repeat-associated core domain-containing protein, partial [Chloroflexota bacterium]|nr:RHS repeat-associated core domain-containing protein [Chloroflexota bacterium]